MGERVTAGNTSLSVSTWVENCVGWGRGIQGESQLVLWGWDFLFVYENFLLTGMGVKGRTAD